MITLPLAAAFLATPLLPTPLQPSQPDELTDRLTSRAERTIEEAELDGLVIVVGVGDDILMEKGWGRLPGGELAAPDRRFRASALVEPLAGVVALQLVAAGELELEEPVGTYLDGVEWEGAKVTLHHLLSQTSGLIGWSRAYEAAGRGDADVAQLVSLVREQGGQAPPGACFEYSESNGLLVAAIVEAVTKKSLAEVITERVLAPSGLEATGFDAEGAPPAQVGTGRSKEISGEQVDVFDGLLAFGEDEFCATARDLFALRRALYGGVLDEAGVRLMTESKRLDDGSETGFGYGVSVARLGDHAAVTTGGSSDGTTVHLAYYPEPEVTVVVLVAAEKAPVQALGRDLARLVLDMPLPGVQDVALDAEEARVFSGRYQVGCTTYDVRMREDGRLSVEVADRPDVRLLYQGQRRFVAEHDPDVTYRFVVESGDEEAQKVIIDERGRISEAVRFQ